MNEGDIYRACAAIMVFRLSDDGNRELLLLHKPRKSDDWQIPQGGVEEGETVEQAALRELQEEASVAAEILGKSEIVYQYDFPESFRRERPDNVCGQRVQFVFALLKEGENVQVDEFEIDGHSWILPEQLNAYIDREEYLKILNDLLQEAEQYL